MMKIKNTIKLVALLGVVVTAVNMFTAAPASALKCASGTVLHADNLCWKESSPYRGTACSNGTGSYSSINKKCNVYAGTPTNDNGSAINYNNIQCPSGYSPHADGKCWKPSYTVLEVSKQECDRQLRNKAGSYSNGKCFITNYNSDGTTQYDSPVEPTGYNANGAAGAQTNTATCPNGQKLGSATDYNSVYNGTQPTNTSKCYTCTQEADGSQTCVESGDATCSQGGTITNGQCPQDGTSQVNRSEYTAEGTGKCGEARTNIIACKGSGMEALGDVLKIILFVLTFVVGIVAVGGIAYAATLYASAEDNAGQISKAKSIIRDVVIGIVLYALLVALVNWLVPTAVFGGGTSGSSTNPAQGILQALGIQT